MTYFLQCIRREKQKRSGTIIIYVFILLVRPKLEFTATLSQIGVFKDIEQIPKSFIFTVI